jgi:predicted amino acid racemase
MTLEKVYSNQQFVDERDLNLENYSQLAKRLSRSGIDVANVQKFFAGFYKSFQKIQNILGTSEIFEICISRILDAKSPENLQVIL